MIGWGHRIRYWVLLIAQVAAVLGYAQIIATLFLEGEVSMAIVVFVFAVLVASVIQTLRRGY